MKIVEYNHSYAEKVADMWNKSGSNWGNDDSVKTGNDVINRQSGTGNLKLYLAVDNDEVVGYCSYSEYIHDEGASYLPLLNVRPDYHGKGVGKALILTVIRYAIQSNWPRFDLFTWSGNIKAMPLYKKCGFFWEKNNRSVHLMNFLPYVYQTEALASYMKHINWYQDSKREIDMKPDGKTENGFDYYRYHFENSDATVITEFEKSGRGLRLIETNDYLIKVTLPAHKLIYNETYKAEVEIVNKTGNPLEIVLIGKDNKNIKASFDVKTNVSQSETIKVPFEVRKTTDKVDLMKTHPTFQMEALINGEKALFKVGIEPKSPVYLNLNIPTYNHIKAGTYTGYLDIENNLEEEATFDIEIPNDYIKVESPIMITLKSKEKRSVPFTYRVNKYGYLKQDATIQYNNQTIHTEVEGIIKGTIDHFSAVTSEKAVLVSGNYHVNYDIDHARFTFLSGFKTNPRTVFNTPQIGLPFNLELANLKPVITLPSSTEMDVSYQSKSFKGIELIIHIKAIEGIMDVQYELKNHGMDRTISLNLPLMQRIDESYVPYNNAILKTTKVEGASLSSIEGSMLDDNWIYSYKDKTGFTWDKEIDVQITGWTLTAMHNDIELKSQSTYKTKHFYMSYAHKDVKSFREYAGSLKDKLEIDIMDLEINNHNPFTSKDVSVKFINLKKKDIKGTITCDGKEAPLDKELKVSPGLKKITLDTNDRVRTFERMIYEVKGDVKTTIKDGNYIVDNGVLTFKANPDYADVVYSITFDNKEWLDHTFPTVESRAWWNKYPGGITARIDGVQDQTLLKEPLKMEFVTLKDNFSQEWTGIKSTITFEKEEDMKGIILEGYHITMPGVPLIHSFVRVTNNSGKYLHNKELYKFTSIKADENKENVRFEMDGITFKCGNVGIEKGFKKMLQLESTRTYKIGMYNAKNDMAIDTQKDYTFFYSDSDVSIKDNESKKTVGDFIFFAKEKLSKDTLKDLQYITFEV